MYLICFVQSSTAKPKMVEVMQYLLGLCLQFSFLKLLL